MTLFLIRLSSMASPFLARLRADNGQTMAEYAILIAVIALIVLVVAITLGSSVSSVMSAAARKL